MTAETAAAGSARPLVLVVEDEPDIAELERYNLEAEGFAVELAFDGARALEAIARRVPDLVVLDLMLPGMSGLELCRKLRGQAATARLPLLMVTARGSEADRVLGLELGADDYMVKPFSPRELAARVRALLRRSAMAAETAGGESYQRGRLRIDFATYEVFVDGQPRTLTARELELLKFFVRHPLRVYTREQLLDQVWGREAFVEPRTVDVHIRRLRQQLERDDSQPRAILTVRNVGYRFNPEGLG